MSQGARYLLEVSVRKGRGAPTMSAEIPGFFIDTLNDALYFSDGVDWDLVAGSGVWATLAANTFTAAQTINMGATQGQDGLILTGAALTSVGTRNSPVLSMRGGAYTGGTARVVEYAWGVIVNDAAGSDDALALVRNYNGGGDVSLLGIDDGGNCTLLGDIYAAGGYRRDVMYSLGALAASQTGARLECGGVVLSYVAKREGSVTGLSVQMSEVVTGGTVTVSVYKNGTILADTSLTLSGSETTERVALLPNTTGLTYVAGDRLDVRYTSGAIGETPALLAAMEIED